MDVVIETALPVEAGWLPELAARLSAVVEIKEELGSIADDEEAGGVSLSTGEVAAEITMELHASFVVQHLHGTIV